MPAGDPFWFLHAFFHTEGGNNLSNLESEDVDTHLDSLSQAEEHSERVELAGTVQMAIREEVPVSNLVTPFWHVGLSDRM